MAFRRGQQVVCIKRGKWTLTFRTLLRGLFLIRSDGPDPKFGGVYQIVDIESVGGEVFLCLRGCDPSSAYWHERFRPVVSKSTEAGMKQLRSLLTDAPEKVEA